MIAVEVHRVRRHTRVEDAHERRFVETAVDRDRVVVDGVDARAAVDEEVVRDDLLEGGRGAQPRALAPHRVDVLDDPHPLAREDRPARVRRVRAVRGHCDERAVETEQAVERDVDGIVVQVRPGRWRGELEHFRLVRRDRPAVHDTVDGKAVRRIECVRDADAQAVAFGDEHQRARKRDAALGRRERAHMHAPPVDHRRVALGDEEVDRVLAPLGARGPGDQAVGPEGGGGRRAELDEGPPRRFVRRVRDLRGRHRRPPFRCLDRFQLSGG